MRLIIEIPNDLYESIKSDKYGVHKGRMYDIIRNGTPFNVNEALDKIRDEIERHRRKTQGIDPYDLVGDCLEIVDKYKESEDKE